MRALKTFLFAALAAAVWTACSDAKARYVDLTTGEPLDLVRDDETGVLVDAETRKPVRMYVDTRTHDTIWGITGKVINGYVHRKDDGGFVYIDENGKEVEYKYKADDDGSMKVKYGDDAYKYKRDEDGSYKVKVGDDYYKKKVEDDGDVKIKKGNKKIKVDAETGERKVKYDD